VKLIIKLFFILGIAFCGLGLLYSFSKLIVLNGLGDIFEMNEARNAKTETIRDSTDIRSRVRCIRIIIKCLLSILNNVALIQL